jgi:hypothetical protein
VRFKVYTGCPGTLATCGTGTNSDLRSFDTIAAAQRPCVNLSQWDCLPGTACCESTGATPCGDPIRGRSYCNDSGAMDRTYWVQVYRLSSGGCASAPLCPGTRYKLMVSNGL